MTDTLPYQEASIRSHGQTLRLPTIGAQFHKLAEQATREGHSHLRYLDALLTAELEEREERLITRRLFEAKLPRLKTLDEFDFTVSPVAMPQMRELAEGGYLERAEPVLFLGETGTGKTHLMTALCVQACQQRKRARFISAASLINDLVEAQRNGQLSRALQRWKRWELLCIDEMGYVPLGATGAELLFQVITERAEQSALIITTNLPFSEWSTVFPHARLCKALLDRVTDRAHIIETGTESYRFRRTVERKKKKAPELLPRKSLS
jgi:DNA replication protein DnaC